MNNWFRISLCVTTLLFLCAPGDGRAQIVEDLGLMANFQDYFNGHFMRGRSMLAVDFDLDGKTDIFSGNPGDESFILRNVGTIGHPRFKVAQILLEASPGPGGNAPFVGKELLGCAPMCSDMAGDGLAHGAAAADFDNDGDHDIFVTGGGREGLDQDYLFQNMLMEEGRLRFEEIGDAAGIRGPVPPGDTTWVDMKSGNAVWGDYDQDGDNDIFVSSFGSASEVLDMRNVLWRNNGDRTFTDVTDAAGLGTTNLRTQHSTFLDIDNDGDLDLYEHNESDLNVLWRNLLAETGTATFEDVTAAFSLSGEDLAYPYGSFASCSADFNNDGWEDIFVSQRYVGREDGSPYPDGHAIFLNQSGTGFLNWGAASHVNDTWYGNDQDATMGLQIGDISGDGTPDIFVGNGGGPNGQVNQFYISTTPPGLDPLYADRSDLIDFPAPEKAGVEYPPYPYRTHGTAFVDMDGDGTLEMAVSNGGPWFQADIVREPNRLFKFTVGGTVNYIRIRPVGDGVTVSKDAVGARLALTISRDGLNKKTYYRTLHAGQCFSGQMPFNMHFVIGRMNTVEELRVTWPNGTEDVITDGLTVNQQYEVRQGGLVSQPNVQAREEAAVAPRLAGAEQPADYALVDPYPNPFNPRAQFTLSVAETQPVQVLVYDMLGRAVQRLYNGVLAQGAAHTFTIDGNRLSSGTYFVRVAGRTFATTRRVTLLK